MSPAGEPESGAVVLGGTYALGAILGTGGTYTVYEATRVRATGADTDDDGTGGSGTGGEPALVVKVLHPHLVDDETARAALAREIAASALVDHPGVSKILDTGEDEVAGATVPWVAARRLPGVPLSEVAAGDGLPWREALALTSGLLDALAAVHAAGLVHRDVGPRNVVVERHDGGDPTVGLLDLGLAAPGGGGGDGDLVAGSVASMSPEQARGRPLDARSDLYAVGSLTYFALTGHAPYERARPDDVLRAHVGAPVPAPSARRAAVPVAVDRFVARAMAKDPAHRFDSAEAMRTVAATLRGVGAPATGAGAEVPGPGTTMTLGQIAAEDPDRTAVIGAAGAAAAVAAAADAEAELQRTRQLGAVDPSDAPAEDSPAPPVAAGETPSDPSDDTPTGARSTRRTVLAVVLVLLLTAGGAGAFWALRDTDGSAPVAPATLSPSLSPSPSSTPTETPTTAPPVGPTTQPDPTAEPTPTPSATPSDDATPTPSPTEEPEPSQDPTPPPTSDATPTDDPAPTSDPTPTSDPEPTSEPDPTPTSDPEPTSEPGTEPTDDGEPVADDEPVSADDATP